MRSSSHRERREELETALANFLSHEEKNEKQLESLVHAFNKFMNHVSKKHATHLRGYRSFLDFLLSPEAEARADQENIWNSLYALAWLTNEEPEDRGGVVKNAVLDDPRVATKIANSLVEDPLCRSPKSCHPLLAELSIQKEPQTAKTILTLIEEQASANEMTAHRLSPPPLKIARPESAPTVLKALYQADASLTDRILAVVQVKGVLTTELGHAAYYFFSELTSWVSNHRISNEQHLPLIDLFNSLLSRKLEAKDWHCTSRGDVESTKSNIKYIGDHLCWYSCIPDEIAAAARPRVEQTKRLLQRMDGVVIPFRPVSLPPRPQRQGGGMKMQTTFGEGNFGVRLVLPTKGAQNHTFGDS